jgi:hypothetical protein
MSGIVRSNNTSQSGIVANVETIDSDDYVDASIDNAHLANDAVGADELASNAVVNASIASGAAVAFSKMANLTVSRALVSDGSGDVSVSAVTSAEIAYLDGVTGAIQTQIDAAGGDFSNGGDNGALVLGTNDSNSLTLETNNTARMVLAAGGDVTVSTGNVVIGTAGKGIDFAINTDAGAAAGITTTAELFSHYEEGTFTPSLQHADNSSISDQTYGGRGGFYTRIGDMIQFELNLDLNALGSLTTGATAFIRGMPFSFTGGLGGIFVCGGMYGFGITDGDQVVGRGIENEDAIRMEIFGSASATEFLSIAAWSADGELIVSGCYKT